MDGTKKLLVFSDAGGTGRSYHACLKAKNQARRIHYLLEPGWRADAAIQGLGRTHRSAQASAPLFRPVTTDVRGERRFISTIARRLDTLGALTRGQRQTGGQNLFDPADNLESGPRQGCADRLVSPALPRQAPVDDPGGLRGSLGPAPAGRRRRPARRPAAHPAMVEPAARLSDRAPECHLRRISRVDRGAGVEAARRAGTLDLGVETLAVERLTVEQDRVIRTDAASGATTHLLALALARRPRPMPVEDALRLAERRDACFLINERSGRGALRLDGRSVLNEDGYRFARATRSCGPASPPAY